MVIFFYTKQYYVARALSSCCEQAGHVCTLFTCHDTFYNSLTNMTQKPDLLVLDYLLINHDLFNVYHWMHETGTAVPLIFYNDPFPPPEYRVDHWETELMLAYDTPVDIASYHLLLTLIADAVESESLHPYISLLQKPRAEPELFPRYDEHTALSAPFIPETLRRYRTINGMSDSLFLILQILYKERKSTLSFNDLKELARMNGETIKDGTLYSKISRLRALLHSFADDIDIITTNGGYRLILYKEKTAVAQ